MTRRRCGGLIVSNHFDSTHPLGFLLFAKSGWCLDSLFIFFLCNSNFGIVCQRQFGWVWPAIREACASDFVLFFFLIFPLFFLPSPNVLCCLFQNFELFSSPTSCCPSSCFDAWTARRAAIGGQKFCAATDERKKEQRQKFRLARYSSLLSLTLIVQRKVTHYRSISMHLTRFDSVALFPQYQMASLSKSQLSDYDN